MTDRVKLNALPPHTAYHLADVTKSVPQFESITPRWIASLLEWKELDTGVYRLVRVSEGNTPLDLLCTQTSGDTIPEGFVDYEAEPREYVLNAISAIIRVDTRVSDLYNKPHDQTREQLRLGVECVKERQESQIINSDDYGLLKSVAPSQRIQTRTGPPTPDDLDQLIAKVWKEPCFFLAHPLAIAAFGRECTRRGVPPATTNLLGATFLTWRGLPLIPTDKLLVDGERCPQGPTGTTSILLIRTGEERRGVLGLNQAAVPGQQSRGLSVRFMGIDTSGVGTYLLSVYCSVAILADDAIGALEGVQVGSYYDYR